MTITRIFQPIPLQTNAAITLDADAAHHVARVLRATVGETIVIFNGEGGEFKGTISEINKKNVIVKLTDFEDKHTESSLELYLAQGISRGEKMDYTIQKAVELGVKKVFPLLTERCNVKLDEDRREKRLQHWSSIIVSACEQSGRNQLPEIFMPQPLEKFLDQTDAEFKFVLAPQAEKKLSQYELPPNSQVVLLIGPEGGLSITEIELAKRKGFLPLNLGPRILRTETAAVAALTALQFHAGDLG